MSAQEATSELTTKKIDGKEEKFRTITTHENGDIKKTSIQQAVSEEDYNKLTDDLKGGSSNGLFFQVIRNDTRTKGSDGEIDNINIYTKAASRSVQKQMNDPKTRFKRDLDEGSIDAIKLQDSTVKEFLLMSVLEKLYLLKWTGISKDLQLPIILRIGMELC